MPNVYFSSEPGAPQLTGQVGDLIPLLDAVLVNGYGGKPPSGWSRPFSGTNKAAYRQAPKEGRPQMYLRIDDSSSGEYAFANGYQDMTDVDTGTLQFPDPSVTTNHILKYNTSSSFHYHPYGRMAGAEWFAVADPRTLILGIMTGHDGPGKWFITYFGDSVEVVPVTDMLNVYIVLTRSGGSMHILEATTTGSVTRSFSNPCSALVGTPMPDPVTGQLLVCPVWTSYASYLRGVRTVLNDWFHVKGLGMMRMQSGNKEYLVVHEVAGTEWFNWKSVAIEISDTWE